MGGGGGEEKIHADFKLISLCQVGPNGEGRLITAPTGDECVSQAFRRAGLNRCLTDGSTQEVCVVCVCVLVHMEQKSKILRDMCYFCLGAGVEKEAAC